MQTFYGGMEDFVLGMGFNGDMEISGDKLSRGNFAPGRFGRIPIRNSFLWHLVLTK